MSLFLQLECIEFEIVSVFLMRSQLGDEENWKSE